MGFRSGGFVDDVLGGVAAGGSETAGWRGEGISDMVLGFFANEDGFVELRRVKGVAEAERGFGPIANGVGMDPDGGCGRFMVAPPVMAAIKLS